jgi:hypothetical protein
MLLGLETEYALGGGAREVLALELIAFVKETVPSLEGMNSNDRYLGNGARLYMDAGLHLEYATPECADPWEVVRRQQAGDRLITEALGNVSRRAAGAPGSGVYRCNVDYSGRCTT